MADWVTISSLATAGGTLVAGCNRDQDDPSYDRLTDAAATGARVLVDLLYGGHEGGQRAIVRFG
jgi:hypothetical protein